MKNRLISTALILVLSCVMLLALPLTVTAADELELTTDYTRVEGTSRDSFEFEVRVNYTGDEARVFDLAATGPQNWAVSVSPSYPKDKLIQDIRLEPGIETLVIQASTPPWLITEPGDYDLTLEISSGDLRESITVQAVITARYAINVTPPTGIYSTEGQSGKATAYTLEVKNTGTAELNNIRFSSNKPQGWEITFTPDGADTLGAQETMTVDVSITPPEKAISGDYMVTLETQSQQVFGSNIQVRVSVETRAVWGWVGVIIIVLVVIVLGYFIMRFSRR
jgi:uncharacterized membrane protein